jgi:actin, other eukaryote
LEKNGIKVKDHAEHIRGLKE